jgi:PAS domain S-box-containing protein
VVDAEDPLVQANLFLEAVIENLPNMIFVKDAERLAFVRFNRAGEELLGVSRAELLGKTDYDFFPREQADFFTAKDRETLARGDVVDIPEEPLKTARGERVLHTKKVPIRDSSGRPRYLLGISEDVTDRKASEVLRARLAAIVEASSDAILSKTLDGVILSWNSGAKRLFGYTAEEAVGRHSMMLYPPEIVDQEQSNREQVARGEPLEPYQSVRLCKDGRCIDVSVSVAALRDASGKPIAISTIARDISDIKRIQRELTQARDAAEVANRELESFSYSVAHDLRAPLRSIDGFSQALLEDCSDKLDEDGRKYLRFVRQSAQLMAQLIDDMLTLSRVTRHPIEWQNIDLTALARASWERLERSDPGRSIQFSVEEKMTARGDPRLLGVVLDNLLGNARKFTSKRAGARVEVGRTTADGRDAYFVRDNGAGFDMAYAGKLFGAFQRLHPASDFEGTGVGLATVQRIVHRHGGRVWGEGRVDAGATFTFTLGDRETG